MNVLISGGTGFVGTELTKMLHEHGHHTFILTRNLETHRKASGTTFLHIDDLSDNLPSMDVVINLAGESLFGYWTNHKKEKIQDSRLNMTDMLVNFMERLPIKPKVFISASAVGFYGTSDDIIYTEETTKHGEDFLAVVTKKWESAAEKAASFGVRTVLVRFGVILGKKGALPMMAMPVKLFAGGKIGNGEQWISWVDIHDVVDIILFCIKHPQLKGPVNITAPQPLRNKDFMRILARTLKRPYWMPVPEKMFSLVTGEMGQLILDGQYVLPNKLITSGYTFRHATLSSALSNIYQEKTE